MKKHYYISYTIDAGQPMEVFRIIEAESIGNAYCILCKSQGAHFHGELPSSEADAIKRIRNGVSCSINFSFLVSEQLDSVDVDEVRQRFVEMPHEELARQFAVSKERITKTGASGNYSVLKNVLSKAENPLLAATKTMKIFRQFERAFRWRGVFGE